MAARRQAEQAAAVEAAAVADADVRAQRVAVQDAALADQTLDAEQAVVRRRDRGGGHGDDTGASQRTTEDGEWTKFGHWAPLSQNELDGVKRKPRYRI